MPDADEYPDWDDEFLAEGGLDPYDYEKNDNNHEKDDILGISELQKSMFENKVINTFVKNAYEFGGTSTLLEVLTQVERKMGWRTEIVADKNALDDYMFYRHKTFDEDIWSYYSNSDEYEELLERISFLSEQAMTEFVNLYAGSKNTKNIIRKKLHNIVWTIFKKLS